MKKIFKSHKRMLSENIWTRKISRRSFFKLLFVFIAFFGVGGKLLRSAQSSHENGDSTIKKKSKLYKSRVVIVRNNLAVDKNGKGKPRIVEEMLNKAMSEFTGEQSNVKAWRKFVSPNDIVGIKVNSIAEDKGVCTQPVLAYAIAECLVEAGVKENNVIIWDKIWEQLVAAGYTINTGKKGVRCFGTNSLGNIPVINKKSRILQHQLYGKPFRTIRSKFSKILVEQCTAIINVPILKDHQMAGMTLSMKNFFGTFDNPSDYHKDINKAPYIADVNMHPEIRKKYRLTICDALRCLYNGGPTGKPEWQWNYNGIIVGTDRVAIDQIGWQIIEEKRKEAGVKSLKDEGREPTYINIAAGLGYELGTNDVNKIEIRKVNLS